MTLLCSTSGLIAAAQSHMKYLKQCAEEACIGVDVPYHPQMVPLHYKWLNTRSELQRKSSLMTQILNIFTYRVCLLVCFYETLQKQSYKTPLKASTFFILEFLW